MVPNPNRWFLSGHQQVTQVLALVCSSTGTGIILYQLYSIPAKYYTVYTFTDQFSKPICHLVMDCLITVINTSTNTSQDKTHFSVQTYDNYSIALLIASKN